VAMQIENPEAEGIFLSCTNWLTMDQIERIEQKAGKPVITSNQASLWATLKLLAWDRPIRGYGVLLTRFG
jgi:maleate isomerase